MKHGKSQKSEDLAFVLIVCMVAILDVLDNGLRWLTRARQSCNLIGGLSFPMGNYKNLSTSIRKRLLTMHVIVKQVSSVSYKGMYSCIFYE